MEVQTDTNSLVIKAPRDLLEEVTDLATGLDNASHTNRARVITLLPLKQSSAARVMDILNDVLDWINEPNCRVRKSAGTRSHPVFTEA